VLDADATVSLLARRPALTAILVDFDGTLAPIVEHPEEAEALPRAVTVLDELARIMGCVAVVSGRPVEFLAAHLPIPRLVLVGGYGIETVVDGVRNVDPRTAPYLDAIEAVAREAEARLPGIYVERKGGVSVTLHWRMAADRAAEVQSVAADLSARHGLDAPLRGRKAVEVRPPIPVDKGSAVAGLLDGMQLAAFAGDDTGDLPAFAALDAAVRDGRLDGAVRIGVRSPEAPAELLDAVDVVVDGPTGLVALLEALAERARRAAD
jgi:trehalose 6-phosphate phosphatase